MSHVQESTLAIDKSRSDISDVLNELWRDGVLLRLEPDSDSITIHCQTSPQMTTATATILAGTIHEGTADAATPDDNGDDTVGANGAD